MEIIASIIGALLLVVAAGLCLIPIYLLLRIIIDITF